MSTCLSEFALDDVILNGNDKGSGAAASHLRSCTACQRRRDERQASLEEIERLQAGSFWQAVRRGYLRRRRSRRAFLWGVPCGAAAVLGWALLPRGHDPHLSAYLGAKGSSTIEIHCRRSGRTFPLSVDGTVEPGDELRFVPRPVSSTVRYVQLASIDGTGRYTPFYPSDPSAASLPLPSPGQPLEGSIRLDSAPGPERLFFVFSPVPLPASVVEQAARQHAAGLRPVTEIAGAQVEAGWLVLAKAATSSENP
jgi:hypothetical protein